MLRFLTAGESHGQALVMTLDGTPAGLELDVDALNAQLRRRQGGYGHGRRMEIESDRAEVLSGVRHGITTGVPIALLIRNRDWVNWQQTMYPEREMPEDASGSMRADVTRPRPGSAFDVSALTITQHELGHAQGLDDYPNSPAKGSVMRLPITEQGASLADFVTQCDALRAYQREDN
jgi:chorismate synthase